MLFFGTFFDILLGSKVEVEGQFTVFSAVYWQLYVLQRLIGWLNENRARPPLILSANRHSQSVISVNKTGLGWMQFQCQPRWLLKLESSGASFQDPLDETVKILRQLWLLDSGRRF